MKQAHLACLFILILSVWPALVAGQNTDTRAFLVGGDVSMLTKIEDLGGIRNRFLLKGFGYCVIMRWLCLTPTGTPYQPSMLLSLGWMVNRFGICFL